MNMSYGAYIYIFLSRVNFSSWLMSLWSPNTVCFLKVYRLNGTLSSCLRCYTGVFFAVETQIEWLHKTEYRLQSCTFFYHTLMFNIS